MKLRCNQCNAQSGVLIKRRDFKKHFGSGAQALLSPSSLAMLLSLAKDLLNYALGKLKDGERQYNYCDKCGNLEEIK